MKLIFLLFSLCLSYGAADESVIHPNLLRDMKLGKSKNVFVSMKGGNDKVFDDINSRSFPSREDKIEAMMAGTKANSALSQAGVLSYLGGTPLSFKTFPLSNEVYVKNAGPLAIMALSSLPNVASVREEEVIPVKAPSSDSEDSSDNGDNEVNEGQLEWGVKAINAPQAWDAGYNGTGVVVAIIDTGVNMKHKDLKNYRGGDFSWLDHRVFIFPPAKQPNDRQGHGSHVCGSAVGQNGVGVAPGAQWIACRGCGSVNCQESHLKECGEWVTCPYKLGDKNKKCNATATPHVVNNSWGGGGGQTWYNDIIKGWIAAGIVPIFAAGNNGDKCDSLGSPGDQGSVIGVAATNITNQVAKFSSRGPAKNPPISKPDLAAPGQDIMSCSHRNNNQRVKMSGTSMASPHVAGAAAILVQAAGDKLELKDRFQKVMQWLQASSVQSTSTGQDCGTDKRRDNVYPNYHVGSGIIDVFAASKLAASGN